MVKKSFEHCKYLEHIYLQIVLQSKSKSWTMKYWQTYFGVLLATYLPTKYARSSSHPKRMLGWLNHLRLIDISSRAKTTQTAGSLAAPALPALPQAVIMKKLKLAILQMRYVALWKQRPGKRSPEPSAKRSRCGVNRKHAPVFLKL